MVLPAIPLWGKICGVILMLTVSLKGISVYRASRSVKLATEPVIGWERHSWTVSDDDVGKTSVDPLLSQLQGVERMINISSYRSSRVLCRLQKYKLNVVYYIREVFRFLNTPAIHWTGNLMLVACFCYGAYHYELLGYVKSSWNKMCRSSKWLSRLRSDTTGPKYPAQVVDGREEPGKSDSSTQATQPPAAAAAVAAAAATPTPPDGSGTQQAAAGPRSFVDLPTGRNFVPYGSGAIMRREGRAADVPERVFDGAAGGSGASGGASGGGAAVGANAAGSEVDIKLKKEVRFSDEFVNYSYGQRDEQQLGAKGNQRRRIPSPAKRIPELGSRGLKQTRSSQGFAAKPNA